MKQKKQFKQSCLLKAIPNPLWFWASAVLVLLGAFGTAKGEGFPTAGWHRGDVSVAQENSHPAIVTALYSESPNIEVDVLDFVNNTGTRVGLLAHDSDMKRITGGEGRFSEYKDISELPKNSADPNLAPQKFMTVIDLFELIASLKREGVTPFVSLDMKEDGDTGEDFGRWIGEMIQAYGFEKHVFASSFFKSNVDGVRASCHECLTGGLVFNDHFALKHLDYRYTSLDLTGFSKATFFLGFLGKKKYPHDFVLIQDDILISMPDLVSHWKGTRKVKFVGAFAYEKERPYSEEEWAILEKADWLELDPPQMKQWLIRHNANRNEEN